MKGTDYKSIVGVVAKQGRAPSADPSFGTTTTKILKDVFLQDMPHILMNLP